jgi:UDP-glucuronate 4-epimerase
MAGVRPSIENPALYTGVNLDGTVNLLDAAAAQRVGRFVFASSSSVYGNNPKTPFVEEDRVDHPISPYAATKKAGELICHAYHHLHAMPIACLRFFTVFGPRQRPDLAIAKFLRLAAQGRAIPVFGDGSTSRDYTFIEDIVAGVLAALDRASGYHVYNLGGSHPVSLSQMIATIERVTGRRLEIDRRPMQAGDVERTWADLSRSRAELGYEPRTTLEAGIARQWSWMGEAGLR